MRRRPFSFLHPLRRGLGFCLVVLWCAGAAAKAPPAEVSRRVAVMGTWAVVEVSARDAAAAAAGAEAAVHALEAAEARLSTWRDDTPLAALNRAPAGRRVAVGPELAGELARTLRWWRRTGGAFNPAVGPLVRAWDLRGIGRTPDAWELAGATAACNAAWLELRGDGAVRSDARLIVEEGGWGKGAALDVAVAAAMAAGAKRVCVNLGGQVAGNGPLEVEVADPDGRSRTAFLVWAPAGSLATSGNGGRRWAAGHILDPRTGRVARDFGSVTVWAPGALAADALATALYVMGRNEGLRWALREPGVEAVFVIRDGDGARVRSTPGLRVRSAVAPGAASGGAE